jgi:hypothetical protein
METQKKIQEKIFKNLCEKLEIKPAKNEKMKFLEWLDKVGNVHRFNPEAIDLALSKID